MRATESAAAANAPHTAYVYSVTTNEAKAMLSTRRVFAMTGEELRDVEAIRVVIKRDGKVVSR